jgi:hypothetical protein
MTIAEIVDKTFDGLSGKEYFTFVFGFSEEGVNNNKPTYFRFNLYDKVLLLGGDAIEFEEKFLVKILSNGRIYWLDHKKINVIS